MVVSPLRMQIVLPIADIPRFFLSKYKFKGEIRG